MNLYIMSRGRAGKVNTLNWIPKGWRDNTYLVVAHSEGNIYREHHPLTQVITAPSFVTNYSQKFQWILDGEGEIFDSGWDKAVILDDDLVFSVRSSEAPGSLISVKDPQRLTGMFDYIEELLDTKALVGVHPRQMGQHALPPYVDNGRIICMQGINRRMIGNVKVDQFPILADVVLNLTLLARGQANAIITTFFQDHGPCQAPGGCSVYRTSKMQRDAVEYIAARFPGFVKVVQRETNDKWLAGEDGKRYDYTAQWKRLYAAGVDFSKGLRSSPDTEVKRAPGV